MKIRNFIILLVCLCAGFAAQDALCAKDYDSDIVNIQESTCYATEFTSCANHSALTSARTISAPNVRTNGFRQTTSYKNLEGKISQTVRAMSKRYFTRTTDLPSSFQNTCSCSGDYLITIGILVI